MRRRITAIIMSAAMAVAFIPTSFAFAGEAPFTIDGAVYGTLQEAVDDCPTDGTETTIKMGVSTYELDEQIEFKDGQNIVLTSTENNIGEIKRADGYTGKFFEINHALELTFDKIIINSDYDERADEMIVVEKLNEYGYEDRDPVEGVKINLGKTIDETGEYPVLKSNNPRLLYNKGAEITMNSGTITGCNYNITGTLYMIAGKFTMNGGYIKDNTATVISANEGVEIDINGGSITGNNCDGCIIENNGGTFNMTGGSITENSSGSEYFPCVIGNGGAFNMTGGSINDNSASAIINYGQITMSGGEIKGNANPYTDSAELGNQAGGILNVNSGEDGGKESAAGTVSLSGSAVIKDNTKGTEENKKTSNLNVVYTGESSTHVYKFDVAGEMDADAYVGVDTVNNNPGDAFAIDTSSSGITNTAAFKNDSNPQLVGKKGKTNGELVWGEAKPEPTPTPAVATGKYIPAKAKAANKSVTVTGNKVAGAKAYDVYGSQCGKKLKKLATVKAGKTLKYTKKNLNNKKAYQFIVKARTVSNGKTVIIGKSAVCHVAMSKHSRTNAKSISVNKKAVTLKVKGTFKIKAKTVKQNKHKKLLKHAKTYRYYTTDKKIAAVSAGGKITAKKAGTCKIYVIANNGVYRTIKLTIK